MNDALSVRHPKVVALGIFFLSLVVSLFYLQEHASYQLLTSDDFFANPLDIYVRDARWAVIPVMTAVDALFSNQHLGRPLAVVVLSLVVATLSTTITRSLHRSQALNALGISLASTMLLLASPNLLWAGGIWYSAIAYLGILLSLVSARGISYLNFDHRLLITGWALGTAITFFSYQPFFLANLIIWWLSSGRSGPHGIKTSQKLQFILVPLLGVALTGGLAIALAQVLPSSRLEDAVTSPGDLSPSFASVLIAYGRADQITLLTGTGLVIALVSILQLFQRLPERNQLFPMLVILSGACASLVLVPIFLAEAREQRFASALLIGIQLGFLVILSEMLQDLRSEMSLQEHRRALSATALSAYLAAAVLLVSIGLHTSAAALVVTIVLWSLLLFSARVLGFRLHLLRLLVFFLLSLQLVGLSQARAQLFENELSQNLDRQIAAEVTFEIVQMDNLDPGTVQIHYEVLGWPDWYSPLLRTHVSGAEVLEQYLSALNSRDFEVTHVRRECPPTGEKLVTTEMTDTDQVLVCVYFDR